MVIGRQRNPEKKELVKDPYPFVHPVLVPIKLTSFRATFALEKHLVSKVKDIQETFAEEKLLVIRVKVMPEIFAEEKHSEIRANCLPAPLKPVNL